MPNTGTLPEVMPPPIQTVLVPHAPNWPQCAGQQRQKIRVPGSILLTVHHIGSTCVPGLTARPIIDLMPLVTRWLILTGNVGAMRHVTLPSEMTCAGILTWRLLTPLKSAAPRHLWEAFETAAGARTQA